MTKFNKMTDDSFDASAALTILGREPKLFSDKEIKMAKKITSDVRNDRAHPNCPNMANWKSMKFSTSFKLMGEFAEALPEPKVIKKHV